MSLSTVRRRLRQKFRSIALPDDLDEITCIDTAGEVHPENAGLYVEEVEAIWSAAQAVYRTGAHPLLSICLRRGGDIVLNRTIGYQRGDAADPNAVVADLTTPICLFSSSKGISAMLLHLLSEQGKIHLLDPVSYYIPEFAAHGKGFITIYQLLSHRAGVPGLGEDIDPDVLYDHERALEMICAAEPIEGHGHTAAYHAITGGFLLDELIRRTTGMNARQYMDRYFRKPLGMRYFRYGVTRRDLPRVAEHRNTGLPPGKYVGGLLRDVLGIDYESAVDLSNSDAFKTAALPSANIYCTAEEAGRFFQMMLDYGTYQGNQVMAPLTVHRATQEVGKAQLDGSLKLPMRYSAGFMLGGSPFGIYGPETHYAFGHLGLSNVSCWADPERDISVAILNTGKPVVGTHILPTMKLQNRIADACRPVRNMKEEGLAFLQE